MKRQEGNYSCDEDRNGAIITGSTGKANILNSYYASVFCCDHNIPKVQLANSGETSVINTKIIRKSLTKIGRNKSVGPDGVPDEFLKLGGEAMIPFLARLLEISLNNATIPSKWGGGTIVVPIYKGGDRSAFANYRPISLTSLVCKQMEHVIAGCLRQVWDKNDWLYEWRHGFGPGYSCESQVITVCQDIADSLDEGVRYRCDYNWLFRGFRFSSLWSAAYETGGLGPGFEGSHLGKGIRCRSYTKSQSRGATIQESHSNLRCAARGRFWPTTVFSVIKWYFEEHWL